MIVLCMASCSTKQQVARESQVVAHEERMAEARDSIRVEKVIVMVHDTIMERTVVHVQTNEAGDTLKVAQVTERDRFRSMTGVRQKEEMVKDSGRAEVRGQRTVLTMHSSGERTNRARDSPLVSALIWVFWIVVGLIVYKKTKRKVEKLKG